MPIGGALSRPSRLYSGSPRERGASRPHPYCCQQVADPRHSLAGCAEPALAGFVTSGPGPMLPGGVPHASLLLPTGRDPALLPCRVRRTCPCWVRHFWARSDAGETPALPGGVPHASLLLPTGRDPAPGCCPCRFWATSYAGETPALPGGVPHASLLLPTRSFASAPNLPLLGSSLLGHVRCGRGRPRSRGASRTHPYCCQQVAIQRYSLAGCAEPALAGFVASGPGPMRARRPRSRGGVPHASLLLPTGRDPALLPCRVRRTCPCWVRRFWATSLCGRGRPRSRGASRTHPYCCQQIAIRRHSFAEGRRTCPCWVRRFWATSRCGRDARAPGGRPARIPIAANRLRSGATPLQGAPNLPLAGFVASGPRPMRARRPRSRGEQLFFCRASSSMPLPTRSLGEDGGVAAAIVGPVAVALVERFRKLQQGSEECPKLEADTGLGQETGLGERQKEAVLQDPSGVGDALPDEQILILANGVVNEVVAELARGWCPGACGPPRCRGPAGSSSRASRPGRRGRRPPGKRGRKACPGLPGPGTCAGRRRWSRLRPRRRAGASRAGSGGTSSW